MGYNGDMYKIDFDDIEGLWESVISAMDTEGERFSVLLSTKGELFEPRMSWMRFRAELIHRGYNQLLNEIEQMERTLVTDKIERELFDAYNSGDKELVDLCVKTLGGVISKSKLGLSKLESDRRVADTSIRARELVALEKFDTKDLLGMLKKAKEIEGASNE